jgi:calcineurin-like phosphoesterase family protein
MIFFTSDQHFGHTNIIKHCRRPFESVQEMDEQMLEAINSNVSKSDTLYILGDFAYRGRDPLHYRSRIKCRSVHLVIGNHDKRSRCGCFEGISDVLSISINGKRIWLSHYPHRSWPGSHRGAWHLYGHCHGTLDRSSDVEMGLSCLDVGVDNCENYGIVFGTPWSIKQIEKVLPRGDHERHPR